MKTMCFLVVAFLALAMAAPAKAVDEADYELVPHTLAQVINPHFRSVLSTHAPEYDSLSRNDQIIAFIQVYKSLNYGAAPGSEFPGRPTAPETYAVSPAPNYQATRSIPSPLHPVSNPAAPPAIDIPEAVPGTGAPPYAPPPVPKPRHVARVHAGP